MSEPISTAVTGVAVAAGKEIATTASKGIGQTVSDMWYAIYGYKWSEKRQKKEIEVARNIEKFKEEIANKAAKIPEENKQEPDIDIIGATLDSARFRVNKQEIRNMFSNLIVSAMDNSKSADIHPSFSEMIKMLSPLDAKNLQYLYQSGDETISKIRMTQDGNGGFKDLCSHIYLGNPETQDNQLIAPSIDNLIRLKLIDVDYETFKNNDALYEKHRNNPLLLQYKQEDEENRRTNQNALNFLNSGGKMMDEYNIPLPEEIQISIKQQIEESLIPRTIDIVKGKISLTALGRNFCRICLSE
ncbi:DUF4393 domain-containing protein [Haemophilus influenzae]|uniref:DUF4393 domain-containing protein n=1 Tax=Haemophilus influenzae TaxID=727 RepID=UPI000E5954A5|nr:DUF4393 domain-containing protein [Haemophilus influenzae]MCK9052572.1 DUF4393 domain-containing protein [Haemophilus influenzae]BBF07660.1 hypothetical protein CHBNIII7_15430 [Haemophilus influenzae]